MRGIDSRMDKRTPTNPRFAAVESRLDTGRTKDKVKLISLRQYLKRKDEPFFRLGPGQLHELFSEYEAGDDDGAAESEDGYSRARDSCRGGSGGGGAGDIAALLSPVKGGPKIVVHDAAVTVAPYERPYLLVDVRPVAEFAKGRIQQARSIPAMHLRQDRSINDLYPFKNKEGTLIILYDESDRLGEAAEAAATLVERGFDNIFVLSRGITEFADRFPFYVEGEIPPNPSSPTKNGASSRMNSRGSESSSGRTAGFDARSDRSGYSDQGSRRGSGVGSSSSSSSTGSRGCSGGRGWNEGGSDGSRSRPGPSPHQQRAPVDSERQQQQQPSPLSPRFSPVQGLDWEGARGGGGGGRGGGGGGAMGPPTAFGSTQPRWPGNANGSGGSPPGRKPSPRLTSPRLRAQQAEQERKYSGNRHPQQRQPEDQRWSGARNRDSGSSSSSASGSRGRGCAENPDRPEPGGCQGTGVYSLHFSRGTPPLSDGGSNSGGDRRPSESQFGRATRGQADDRYDGDSARSGGRGRGHSYGSGRAADDDAASRMSNMSVADSIISRAQARKRY